MIVLELNYTSILDEEIKLYWTLEVGGVSLKFESSFDMREVLYGIDFFACQCDI